MKPNCIVLFVDPYNNTPRVYKGVLNTMQMQEEWDGPFRHTATFDMFIDQEPLRTPEAVREAWKALFNDTP